MNNYYPCANKFVVPGLMIGTKYFCGLVAAGAHAPGSGHSCY